MSRARHTKSHGMHHMRHRDDGGRVGMRVSGNPDVFEEADERKHGGKVHKKKHVGHPEGKKAKHRMDRSMKRAKGGMMHDGHHEFGVSHKGMMHKGRKAGGRVGSDKSPLTSAHHGGMADERAGGQPD